VTIFFYNPNIHPVEEYEIRKEENKRFAAQRGIPPGPRPPPPAPVPPGPQRPRGPREGGLTMRESPSPPGKNMRNKH